MSTPVNHPNAEARGPLELPDHFSFSQSSLQAYEDCPRRFWLAYVQQLPWPAVEASPVQEHEQLMRLGKNFHQLIERAENGIDPDLLSAGLLPPLSDWFADYRAYRPDDLPTDILHIEQVLSIPFADANNKSSQSDSNRNLNLAGNLPAFRLAAKYDLIAADEERIVIIDWKTNRQRSDPATLRQRLQTAVYLYVIVEAGPALGLGEIKPEQVEMRYWFTAAPAQPISFRYSRSEHTTNRARLRRLLESILVGHSEADFPKVPDTPANRRRFCNYCIYRSRCNRGIEAGSVDELPDLDDAFAGNFDEALEFTLDEVEALSF